MFCVDINEDASQAFSGSGDKASAGWVMTRPCE